MSKALDEYEGRKSCAITTARRLAQFLGDERIKDKGLNCNYVIAKRPDNLPTSDRAIPVAIFSTEPSVARTYLRKWCGDVSGGDSPAPTSLFVCTESELTSSLAVNHAKVNTWVCLLIVYVVIRYAGMAVSGQACKGCIVGVRATEV